MKLGIVARSDNTGLGNQTRELVKMLNPDKIMLIDSTRFNNNRQNPEWYKGHNVMTTDGFPTTEDITTFIRGLDAVLTCETFYRHKFITLCRLKGVKTILQYNYEFLDYLQTPDLPFPDVLVAPSKWHYEDVVKKFRKQTKIIYLPPPTDHKIFGEVKSYNLENHNRLLHIGGKAAALDRNGTQTVIEMLQYSKSDYELVVRSQTPLGIKTSDSRLTVDTGDIENHHEMYRGFDAMVLPRRYAGLCLPMNEALMSGLPVFMTNIEPNNLILPAEWLAKSRKINQLMTRTMLDVYGADPKRLAQVVDNYMKNKNKINEKQRAYEIGFDNFSPDVLKDKYLKMINE